MLSRGNLSLYLQSVSYTYPHSSRVALSDITYTFTGGATAIVGPNGAGKSTLVKLLTGLLEPTNGQIRFRLADGTYVSAEKLHKAVLFQEPSHLYMTIRQNVTMRFEKSPDEDEHIYNALEKAGLSGIVNGLADGIDTLVGAGFGGQTDLSGGQWQRLALARLIYQDAPVIILDEPVASLDPQGERAVFELFSQMAYSRIIIFTTHRYDSIPKNTKIVVMVDGVISESGTHEELLQKQRDYWSLYMSEASNKAMPLPAGKSDYANHAGHALNGHSKHSSTHYSLPVALSPSKRSDFVDEFAPPLLHIVSDGEIDEPCESSFVQHSQLVEQTTSSASEVPVLQPPILGRRASRFRKYPVLIAVFLVLLFIGGAGTVFLMHSNGNRLASSALRKSVSSTQLPTQLPGASFYPVLVGAYTGTAADLMTQEKTTLLLTGIQQHLGTIQGSFQGLGLAGPLTGTVTTTGQVQFTVTLYGGEESLAFEGTIKVGGDIVGTFFVLNQHGQRTGESGLWNVSANSSGG